MLVLVNSDTWGAGLEGQRSVESLMIPTARVFEGEEDTGLRGLGCFNCLYGAHVSEIKNRLVYTTIILLWKL